MVDVALSSAMRSTLLSLTSIQSQIGVLQTQLASGKKVNSRSTTRAPTLPPQT